MSVRSHPLLACLAVVMAMLSSLAGPVAMSQARPAPPAMIMKMAGAPMSSDHRDMGGACGQACCAIAPCLPATLATGSRSPRVAVAEFGSVAAPFARSVIPKRSTPPPRAA